MLFKSHNILSIKTWFNVRIHTNLDELNFNKAVVAIGAFDGVHRGHQHVIKQVKEKANALKGESVVVTFQPHPRIYFNSTDYSFKTLNTHLDKVDRFYHENIDHLVVIQFNNELSHKNGEAFIIDILVKKLGMYHLVLGYDNQFGKDRLYDDNIIKALSNKYNFTYERLEEYYYKNQLVSSSMIRKKLSTGNIREANDLLGYEHFIYGKVTFGNQIGKKIGFPTANIEFKDGHKMLPCNGVYIVKVNWNGEIHYGMCNIGIRPTINKSSFSIEVHLFNFNHNIYDDFLTLYILERIRDEKRFHSLEELVAQLEKDKIHSQKYLAKTNKPV